MNKIDLFVCKVKKGLFSSVKLSVLYLFQSDVQTRPIQKVTKNLSAAFDLVIKKQYSNKENVLNKKYYSNLCIPVTANTAAPKSTKNNIKEYFLFLNFTNSHLRK